jgi:S-DNA-T family DNA segregation ATPase FtsK/SpoIIIE
MIWNTVVNIIGIEGALLTFFGVFIIGLIILFNTSLDRFVDFLFAGFISIGEWISGFGKSKESTESFLEKEKPSLRMQSDAQQRLLVKEPVKLPSVPMKQPNEKMKTGDTAKPTTLTLTRQAHDLKDVTVWEYPPLELLSEGPKKKADRGDMRRNAEIIEQTLDGFGIQAKVVEVNPGPAVTQYSLRIALGTKVSKITSLSSDLALALAAPTGQVRIEAPIPGRNLVGIEIPNRGLEFVTLKQMLSHESMSKEKSSLLVPLGLDVSGNPISTDIHAMPHVLIAGATGSGKSVLINSWITSFLMRTNPQQVRFILVDPKRVELTGYNGVPHLLAPVIVEADKILSSLRWAIKEMESRYKQFAEIGVRNIESFNEQSGFQAMPYIIIVIDELADLMMYAPVEVEDAICRLAQMARATGIHLVLATQRPSVDVLTGLIKANVPTRIAFNVTAMVDSRVIIDMPGAERLLGRGDMLFIPPDQAKPTRIQGAFVSEKDVNRVVEYLKSRQPPTEYSDDVLNQPVTIGGKRGGGGGGMGSANDGKDALFDEALRLVCQHDKASASLLQRRLSVGYARAARILDQLEEAGIIGPSEGSKPRDVLMKSAEEYFAAQETNTQVNTGE